MTARRPRATVSLRLLEYAALFTAAVLPILYLLAWMPSTCGIIWLNMNEAAQPGEVVVDFLRRMLLPLLEAIMFFAIFGWIWFAAGYLRRMAEQRNAGNGGQKEAAGDGLQEAR